MNIHEYTVVGIGVNVCNWFAWTCRGSTVCALFSSYYVYIREYVIYMATKVCVVTLKSLIKEIQMISEFILTAYYIDIYIYEQIIYTIAIKFAHRILRLFAK